MVPANGRVEDHCMSGRIDSKTRTVQEGKRKSAMTIASVLLDMVS